MKGMGWVLGARQLGVAETLTGQSTQVCGGGREIKLAPGVIAKNYGV